MAAHAREHLPLAGDPLPLVPAAVLERDARAVDEVARRRRGEDLARTGQREQARREVDREIANVVADRPLRQM